ncbi:hypothetical protein TNCV_4551241 [Trichonephila clavipes]|nr:hypothetical protein TNCV_4551241 [Trichonephila clavipes]
MTSARGHGAIVYCLNSGSEDSQTGHHNGDEGEKKREREEREEPGLGWRKGKKPCPGWRRQRESRDLNGREAIAIEKGLVRDLRVERR